MLFEPYCPRVFMIITRITEGLDPGLADFHLLGKRRETYFLAVKMRLFWPTVFIL